MIQKSYKFTYNIIHLRDRQMEFVEYVYVGIWKVPEQLELVSIYHLEVIYKTKIWNQAKLKFPA